MNGDLQRLATSTLTYGLGQVLSRSISLLLLPLFTAYLSPAEYGISAILGVIVFVITPVFSLGLGTAVGACYFDSVSRDHKEATIWMASILLVASTAVLAVSGISFAVPLSLMGFQTPAYHHLVSLSLLTACLTILVTPFMLYLQFEGRARLYVTLTLLSVLVSATASVVMVVVLRRGVLGLIEAGLIGQAVNTALWASIVLPGLRFRFSWPLGKTLLRLGIPLVPSFALLFLLQHGNKYVLQWYSGLDSVGIYSIGFNIGLTMTLLVTGFTNAWTPYFMSYVSKPDEARVLFGRVMLYYVFSFGGLSLLFFILAKPMIMILTQPAFHDAYKSVGFSASAQFLAGMFSVLLPGIYFAKEVRYVTVVQAISAVVSLGLGIALVPTFGIIGAGLTLAAGHLTMAAAQHVWNVRRRYLDVAYPWGRLLTFACCYVAIATITLWDRSLPLPTEILFSAAVTVVLIAMMLMLVPSAEREAIRRLAVRVGAQPAVPYTRPGTQQR